MHLGLADGQRAAGAHDPGVGAGPLAAAGASRLTLNSTLQHVAARPASG